jgi:hypothetical protein
MTDPRPAEGPDREALRADFTAGRPAADLLAEVLLIHRPDWEAVCRGCSGGERWPCDTYTLAEAAAALLPTPPAPPLHVTQADIGHSTRMAIAHTTPPAPGDREGLRAEVEAEAALLVEIAEGLPDEPANRLFGMSLRLAALAARDTDRWCNRDRTCDLHCDPATEVRPDPECPVHARDTDQGARDALAAVEGLALTWQHLEDEARDEGTAGTLTYIGAARALRAALARATPEAGEGT